MCAIAPVSVESHPPLAVEALAPQSYLTEVVWATWVTSAA